MLWVFEFKEIEARTTRRWIQCTTDGENGIAYFFGFQTPAIHSPQILIAAVDRRVLFVVV